MEDRGRREEGYGKIQSFMEEVLQLNKLPRQIICNDGTDITAYSPHVGCLTYIYI